MLKWENCAILSKDGVISDLYYNIEHHVILTLEIPAQHIYN